MLGKQITRVGSFSMVHAAILVAALGMASFLSPAIQNTNVSAPQRISDAETGQSGPILIRATFVTLWDCGARTGRDV